MLEWMIVAGGVCGCLGAFGMLVITLDGLWRWRVQIVANRALPQARLIRWRCTDQDLTMPRDNALRSVGDRSVGRSRDRMRACDRGARRREIAADRRASRR